MVTHKLNKKQTATWEIDTTGDTWVLGEKGRIETIDMAGIHMKNMIDAATIRISGDIQTTNHAGVFLSGEMADLTVYGSSRISGIFSILYENALGAFSFANDGFLNGTTHGVSAIAMQDKIDIVNSGRIIAGDTGVVVHGAGADIINTGQIKGADGIWVTATANDISALETESASTIVNKGVIAGQLHSISATSVAVDIRNKGTLNGEVSLSAGNDVVINKGGVINGDVWLGDGHDVFKGTGGKLNGIIYGGAGSDIITLSSAAQTYVEAAGEGTDAVLVNATYQLGENIERLTLLGKAKHTGIGNSLDNQLTGNKGANVLHGLDGKDELDGDKGNDRLYGESGDDSLFGQGGKDLLSGGAGSDWLEGGTGNDRLFGGADADLFIFQADDGRDTIMDFEDGSDQIAIGYTGLADFNALSGKISQHGEDVWIELSDTDVLVIRDRLVSQIDATDFWAIS